MKADLSEADDIAEPCAIVDREFGRLDVIVSNTAGGGFHARSSVVDLEAP